MSADGAPDSVILAIERLGREADGLYAQGQYARARELWSAAWNLVPHPRNAWSVAGEIQIAIGDCHLHLAQDRQALEAYRLAQGVAGYRDHQQLHFRLGLVCYELDLLDHADAALRRAEQLDDSPGAAEGDAQFNAMVDRKLKLWPQAH